MLFSCAKTQEEKVDSAIDQAQYYLTNEDCEEARDALDEVSYQDDDALYVSLYAATYACEAGYSELEEVLDNISNISFDSTSLFGSVAALPSSNETVADSDDFINLQTAINTIIESSSTMTTQGRVDKFGDRGGTDLSFQALYMILIQMGKFFAYYGNADANGLKGQGSSFSNVCIANYLNYTRSPLLDATLGATPVNGCDTANDGHPDLDSSSGTPSLNLVHTRLCYGIVLFNNFFEILTNVSIPNSDSLGDLSTASTLLAAIYTTADALEVAAFGNGSNLSSVASVTNQAACEGLAFTDVISFYVFLIETNFGNT